MTNVEIAQAFERIAAILNLQDENPFRIRAYERAAQTIQSLSEDLKSVFEKSGKDGLKEIPGIGEDLANKMIEMIETGKLAYLKEIESGLPKGLLEITGIQGVGPKKTKFLWKKFKVENVTDLEKLLDSGKLNAEKGWGDKSVDNIKQGIAAMRLHNSRIALPVALDLAEKMVEHLKNSKLCEDIEIAGSTRRRKESIGDIDILVTSKHVEKVMDVFCSFPLVDRILAKGGTRASVHLSVGVNSDLRVLDKKVFGAALHYFTGNKEHNIRLRRMGIERGLTISEYGVHEGTAENKGKLLASRTEEDVFKAVGLPYIPPELREDRGEIDAAKRGTLPTLIELKDLNGDLHLHSNFSDGDSSMTQMAEAAKKVGHSYIAITDHASPIGIVNGIKENNIKEYLKKVDEARKNVSGIEILSGSEVDIMVDGSLFLPDKILTQLDWVVASVHGNFKMTSEQMTKRILRAFDNPHVCVFAHPTSRLLLQRDGITYDFDTVFKKAAEKNIALEINASVDRLDLNDVLAKRAKELGCTLVINSDAHHPRHFDYRFGITQARRGWLEKKDVLNTKTFADLQRWIAKRDK